MKVKDAAACIRTFSRNWKLENGGEREVEGGESVGAVRLAFM